MENNFKNKLVEAISEKIASLEKTEALLSYGSITDCSYYYNKKNDIQSTIKIYNEILALIARLS